MDPDTALVLEDIRQMLAKSEQQKTKIHKPAPLANPYAYVDSSISATFSKSQQPRKGKYKKPPSRIPSMLQSSVHESKEESDIRAIALPYMESSLLVTQSFDVVEKYGYSQHVGRPADKTSDTLLPSLMKRYPRFCHGITPPSLNTSYYRARNDQWLARLIEECYDVASSDCCKPVSQQKSRRRFELDLGAMDAFPLVVRRHVKLLYSTLGMESVVCLELVIALDKSLRLMESVGVDRQISSELVSNSGRAELFSSFLAEELEVDRLAVYLHTRDFTQQLLGVRFRELYVTLQVDTAVEGPGALGDMVPEKNKKRRKNAKAKKSSEDPGAAKTTILLQDNLFLDPVVFHGNQEELEACTQEVSSASLPGRKVSPPSVKIPFFLKQARDACLPEAPLLCLDMRTLKVLCQSLTPDCPERVRKYMLQRCLFWTDVLCSYRGSMFKVWQQLKNVVSFFESECRGLEVEGLKVVPAHVFLWMLCTEMGSYADVTEQIVATETGVSEDTTTEQSVAMLNNVYDQDRAREKAMDEAIRLEGLELSQCRAHLLQLEKRKKQVQRRWRAYTPDLTLQGLQAKQAEANKGFSVSDVTDLSAEILEFEGLRSALEAKLKRLRKNKASYLQDVEDLWEVALKGKRKFQGLKPIKSRKQVKPIKGTTNTRWRDVVVEKIIHAMKRNIQMTGVERAARVSMEDTISSVTSMMSDETGSKQEQGAEDEGGDVLGRVLSGEEDTASLIRELEREAQELAAVGGGQEQEQEEGEEQEEGGQAVSLMESKAGEEEEELVLDMAHYDTQHVEIRERWEEGAVESSDNDVDQLDTQRRALVSREAQSFVQGVLTGLTPPSEKEEDRDSEDRDNEDRNSEDKESHDVQEGMEEDVGSHVVEVKEVEGGKCAAIAKTGDVIQPERTELGEYSDFEFVSPRTEQRVRVEEAGAFRARLKEWIFVTAQRHFSRRQDEEMMKQHMRNMLAVLIALRREKMNRKVAKVINGQNLKYFLFIKGQHAMKTGLISLLNSVAKKKKLITQNNTKLEVIKTLLHVKMRSALVTMAERMFARGDDRARLKQARKQLNSRLFNKRNACLMEWLVWTKHVLHAKHSASLRIQQRIRCFLAIRRVRKCRQVAKIQENALVECSAIGRQKVMRRTLQRLGEWRDKFSRLRRCEQAVRRARTSPVLLRWRRVCAALKISRAVRGAQGRGRAKARRLRWVRAVELEGGYPVICALNTQQRILLHWKILCASRMLFRNFLHLSLLTKVARRFAHWKNMHLEYKCYLSQRASVIVSVAKMFLSKRHEVDFHVVRQGVLSFQCVVRSRFAQQVVDLLRARMYASVTIQRSFRGHSCRRGLRDKRILDIHHAAANNKYERLLFYCEGYFNLTFQPDEEGNLPMHTAAKHASKRCLKLLIKFHHDPTLTNANGHTPLHLLIMSSAIHRDAVFEYMLEIGFDEEQYTSDGKSALVLACEFGRTRIVNLCLEHGLDPNQPDYHFTSCLQYAVLGNFAPIVRTLLLYDADANQVGYEGMSPLHDVAGTGNLEIAKILVEESKREEEVDINVQDATYGYTPIMLAARNGFDEIVQYFCSRLCSVELVDASYWTAAHHCALANNAETVNHLREMVAEFDVVDYQGNTPLHVAAENGNHLTVRELLSLGALSSPQNYEGDQPAHLAAKNNRVACLNLLVRYDEHIGRVNFNHRTPLGMAKFHMAVEAREFLEEWFTKVAGPDKRNTDGDIWWDRELDGEVGEWTSSTDEANHRIFTNTVTGEVTLTPPSLTYQHVTRVAEKAQAEMRMKVIQNEAENDVNEHVYLEEHALVKHDIEQEIKFYDAATVITKTTRRKFAYKLFRKKMIDARRKRVLTSFFLRALRVLAIRRMLRNTRMWRRVQAVWRGYFFRCRFYYWDGTYEALWYARARRRLARNIWTLYKDYKFRQMRTTLRVAAAAPKMLDEWDVILDRLGHPLRVIGVIEEYLYPETKNIFFYRNVNTGNIVFQRPQEIVDKDLQDHRDRVMLTEKGFTKSQERLAKKLQSMWRGYKVRTRFRVIIRAKAICVSAEKRFLEHPDNDQHFFNYTLYVQVVLHDYDRARPLHLEMLRKMTHRGPDIAQILFAYAIFSFVVHDQEFEECMSLVERGRVAEERQYNYLRRQKLKETDMEGYERYTNIPVSQGSTFELASIGFFHHATTQQQISEAYHNYAACSFLIYHNFENAFDAFLKAFQLDPFNSKARQNYDSMMNFVSQGDAERGDRIAQARMQVLGDKDNERRIREETAREALYRRQQSAIRIQRWYSHHKGLRNYYKFLEKLRRKKRRAGLIK